MTSAGPAGPARVPRRKDRLPFLVPVRSLRAHPGRRHELHLAGGLPDLAVSFARVPEGSEVHFDGTLESVLGGMSVVGTVRAPWRGTCRRCLEEASGELEVEIRELLRDAEMVAGEGRESAEETYLVGADQLDVGPIVRDACILELPLAPVCSESCRGICATCGVNLNTGECSCAEVAVGPFSGLSSLLGVDGERSEDDNPGATGRKIE